MIIRLFCGTARQGQEGMIQGAILERTIPMLNEIVAVIEVTYGRKDRAFMVMSRWESEDAIKAAFGPDLTIPAWPSAEVRDAFESWTLEHYEEG